MVSDFSHMGVLNRYTFYDLLNVPYTECITLCPYLLVRKVTTVTPTKTHTTTLLHQYNLLESEVAPLNEIIDHPSTARWTLAHFEYKIISFCCKISSILFIFSNSTDLNQSAPIGAL